MDRTQPSEIGSSAHASGHAAPPDRSARDELVAAAIFLVATIAIWGLGALVTAAGRDWFDQLDEPGFPPPGWLISIVWALLYVLIAAAGWIAWRSTLSPVATVAWAVHMGLNLAWTSVYFGLESVGGGLLVVAALFVAVLIHTVVAWRASVIAGALLVPVAAWVAFAFVLNAGYAALNFD